MLSASIVNHLYLKVPVHSNHPPFLLSFLSPAIPPNLPHSILLFFHGLGMHIRRHILIIHISILNLSNVPLHRCHHIRDLLSQKQHPNHDHWYTDRIRQNSPMCRSNTNSHQTERKPSSNPSKQGRLLQLVGAHFNYSDRLVEKKVVCPVSPFPLLPPSLLLSLSSLTLYNNNNQYPTTFIPIPIPIPLSTSPSPVILTPATNINSVTNANAPPHPTPTE
eukprot:TRINITY_DN2155_c0_g3_i1.p1 TRINITY_DN2155_c0_g3~~TRINITY_DN2155_c0_g3_i1.p1  ORF type:complete len:237 (-),score=7.80 TRINITY_DN2155_c0_g3_i1:402-1061(-)